MKKTFIQYDIDDPIYRANLSLFIGNVDDIKKHLVKAIKIPEKSIGKIYDGKFLPFECYKILIMPDFNLGTLVHEIIHYSLRVLKERGVPIKYENDEAIAYYVEMTLSNILKVIDNKKNAKYRVKGNSRK